MFVSHKLVQKLVLFETSFSVFFSTEVIKNSILEADKIRQKKIFIVPALMLSEIDDNL